MVGWSHALSLGVSGLAVAAMAVSLLVLLVRYCAEPFAPGIAFGPLIRRLIDGRPLIPDQADDSSTANRQLRRRLRRNEWALHTQLQILAWVFCVALLSRLVILASVLVGCGLNGSLMAFFNDFHGHWVRWDAEGYLELARQGYNAQTESYLVLLPLYPALVKGLSFLLMGNVTLAGFLISNLALVGAGWAMYLLVQESQGQVAARRAVQLLMFSPLSVFFSVPYAESLFLFLTLLSVLLARRQGFIGAVVAGMFAAATRLVGILTIIPVFLEVLKYERSVHLWPRHKARCVARLALYTLLTAMISLGFVAYLLVNRFAMGDAAAFINVQLADWNQTFGSLANTLRYSIETALASQGQSPEWLLGVWIPQSAAIILSVGLLLWLSPRMEPGDGLYAWVYLTLTFAPTWLLTGPRMALTMYSVYPMLTLLVSRRNSAYATLLVVSLLLMIGFSYMYTVVGNVL